MKTNRAKELIEIYKGLSLDDKQILLNFLTRDIFVNIEIFNGEDHVIGVCEDIEDICQNGTMLQIILKGKIDFKDYLQYLK